MFLSLYKSARIFSFSLPYMCTYTSLLFEVRTTCVLFKYNQIQEKHLVLLPQTRAKQLSSLINVFIGQMTYRCWKWQIWEIPSKSLSWCTLLVTLQVTALCIKKKMRFLITSPFSSITHFATLVLPPYPAHGSKEFTTRCLL
jgi:hypothetical protein